MEIEQIKQFVKKRHGEQKRKQGTPYYLHPYRVCQMLQEKGFNQQYQITGLFHDLLEDTNTTYEEIIQLSNLEIAEAVKRLTKEQGYQMEEYMDRIKENEIAKMVKLADRVHNLEEAIWADFRFQTRYVEETEKYFVLLAQGTPFEAELKENLQAIKNKIKEEKDYDK